MNNYNNKKENILSLKKSTIKCQKDNKVKKVNCKYKIED